MKRLWVRISSVAAVVASLGGGGYYFATSGRAANESESESVAAVAGEDGSVVPPEIMPITDVGEDSSPVFDGSSASSTGGGYSGAPNAPAQAAWQDSPSQPIIRQVSGSESDTGYGDGGYGVSDTPPVDPTAGYRSSAESSAGASPAYDPGASYGGLESAAGNAAPGYGGDDSSAAVADPPGYAISDVQPDPNAGYESTSAPGYASDGAVPPPTMPSQDVSQPVTAPSFATGETVTSSASATADLGPTPTYGNTSPPADSTRQIAPQFDDSPAPVAMPQETRPAAVYASTPSPAPTQPAYNQTQPAYNQTPAMPAAAGGLVAATPGARNLDGRQTPTISVEKTAPAEIQVGKPAAFKALVRNTGQVTAKNVVVTDRVPKGTRLVDATPQPSQAADGSLVWQFESLAAGDEVLISMEVMPEVEGEIGSQALVTFQAQASVRTICTKPQLLVEHSTDAKVLIGEDVVFDITISNPGSGDATGIVLEEDVPKGLSHFAGGELEYEVGTLRPNESRRLELVLKASEAGITNNKLRVRGDANLLAEHSTQLEVIAPKLLVGISGPRRRYLDRQVTYQVAFGNAGTAIAKNVELATYLPKGLKFVSTNGKGQYVARDHAVYWSLDQLAPSQEGSVELTALPIATGEQKLQIEGTADLGLSQKYEHTTLVEAITELVFTVSDTQDPIEVGSETTYEIRIVNNGSKTATNVQVAAILPAELTPISGEGRTRVNVQGQQVIMDPIERVGPRDEAVYKIKVKGLRAGDHLIDVRLVSDEVPTPVTKQESTKVYADGL